MNKKLLTNVLVLSGSILITSVTSFLIGKNTSVPKNTAGTLYIQHNGDDGSPELYLGDVDPKLINDTRGKYAIVKLVHIRK